MAASLTRSDFWLSCVLHVVFSGAFCPKPIEDEVVNLFLGIVLVVIITPAQTKVINQNMSPMSFRHNKWLFADFGRHMTGEGQRSSSLRLCP